VVATEVPLLSARSATAARQIRTLIESTLDSVSQAGGAAGDAQQTIDQIVERAGAMTARGSEIAADVVRRNTAVAQVRQTLENLDRGRQQDAALVEETAPAAGALYDQAQSLHRTVTRLRLPAESRGSCRRQARASSQRPSASTDASASPRGWPWWTPRTGCRG